MHHAVQSVQHRKEYLQYGLPQLVMLAISMIYLGILWCMKKEIIAKGMFTTGGKKTPAPAESLLNVERKDAAKVSNSTKV